MRARSVWIFIGSGLTVAALNLYLVSLSACTQANASPEPAPSAAPSTPVQQPQAPQPLLQWAAPSDDGPRVIAQLWRSYNTRGQYAGECFSVPQGPAPAASDPCIPIPQVAALLQQALQSAPH